MSQFTSPNSLDDQSPSLHSDFSQSLLSDNSLTQQKKPLISFKYHPGFLCFFEDYVNRQGWTFHECYDKVFKSHHEMTKIKRPVQQIVNDKSIQKQQKLKQLMLRAEKGKVFAFYEKRKLDGELQLGVISNEDKKIKDIEKLKRQLEKLNGIKDKVIKQKKKEFQLKQIQRSKEQELEIETILNEKERRANLIRKIQTEAMERRMERSRQKELNPGFIQSTFGNCQIM